MTINNLLIQNNNNKKSFRFGIQAVLIQIAQNQHRGKLKYKGYMIRLTRTYLLAHLKDYLFFGCACHEKIIKEEGQFCCH